MLNDYNTLVYVGAFRESLSHVQGSLITQTCLPVETWKLEREETVAKDPDSH
ncbi:hypothetical protein APTSU1_001582100 [Apodemus speciosus]|uniref:Uncharacterized protein n=1 Tax=Apodemus speciosus TaxID=105296 RepID=A0ABQ0FMX5_APOSI